LNILLDTHVALWAITDSPRLPKRARKLLALPEAVVWISVASVWEIAIKRTLGRGDMPVSSQDAVSYFRDSGYRFLAIEPEHAVATETLPPHHHDPFDRILIAQAQVEPMRLVTHDSIVASYSEAIIKV